MLESKRVMSEFEVETDLETTATIKLYYDLALPKDSSGPLPLLIAVHGYGAHKRHMMREAKLVVPDGFAIASLQAPYQHFRATPDGYRVGFGWLTDFRPAESIALHHRFLLEVISGLSRRGIADPSRVILYGFSQAAAVNFRFALSFPDLVTGIVAVCGGIPGDLETNPAFKDSPAKTLYIFGNDDEFYSNEKFAEFDRRLRDRLPNYRSRQFAAKHEITNEMRDEIRAFLAGDFQ